MNQRSSLVPRAGDGRPPATLGRRRRPLLSHSAPLPEQVVVSSADPRGRRRRGLPLLAASQGRARPLGPGGGARRRGHPLRRREVHRPDPTGPWSDLEHARRVLLVWLGMEAGSGRWRGRLRMAATWWVRGGSTAASRAHRGCPHDAFFGGGGEASRRPTASGGAGESSGAAGSVQRRHGFLGPLRVLPW
jgi:hypothetical protein